MVERVRRMTSLLMFPAWGEDTKIISWFTKKIARNVTNVERK